MGSISCDGEVIEFDALTRAAASGAGLIVTDEHGTVLRARSHHLVHRQRPDA